MGSILQILFQVVKVRPSLPQSLKNIMKSIMEGIL